MPQRTRTESKTAVWPVWPISNTRTNSSVQSCWNGSTISSQNTISTASELTQCPKSRNGSGVNSVNPQPYTLLAKSSMEICRILRDIWAHLMRYLIIRFSSGPGIRSIMARIWTILEIIIISGLRRLMLINYII